MHKIFKRAYLRAWARRQKDKEINKILKDEKLFDYVFAEIEEGHSGLFSDLIAWITSDPEGFFEFVKAIIALFGM